MPRKSILSKKSISRGNKSMKGGEHHTDVLSTIIVILLVVVIVMLGCSVMKTVKNNLRNLII